MSRKGSLERRNWLYASKNLQKAYDYWKHVVEPLVFKWSRMSQALEQCSADLEQEFFDWLKGEHDVTQTEWEDYVKTLEESS